MATPEFLKEWRTGIGELSNLLKVELPRSDGTQTDTLYLAQREVATYPDSVSGDPARLWTSMVKDFMPVHVVGGYAATHVPLAEGGATLFGDRSMTLVGQGANPTLTKTVRQSLASHDWYAAKVTIWRYLHALTDFKHAQQIFKGDVIDVLVRNDEVELTFRQRTDWNRPVAPRYVTKKEYPRAPDDTVGLPIPLVIGNISGLGLRRPWTTPYGTGFHALEHLRSGKRVCRAVLVDTGRGSGLTNPSAKVLVAGHQCKSVLDTAQGTMVFMERDGKLCLLEPAAGNIINTATEAGVLLPDNMDFAWLGLSASEIIPVANSAFNPRHALEPSDHTFALLDYTAGYRELRIKLPSIPGPGDLVGWQAFVGYQSSSNFGGCGLTIANDAVSLQSLLINPLPVKTTPGESGSAMQTGGWGAFPTPDDPWAFGTDRVLRIVFDPSFGTQAGWMRIFFVGVAIQFKPRQELIQTERVVMVPAGSRMEFVGEDGSRSSFHTTYAVPQTLPATTELRGKFFANPQGAKDSDGSITGTVDALIEKLPDVMRYLLISRGAQQASQIETAASTYGSLVDAREHMREATNRDPVYALSISEKTDVRTIVEHFASNALAQLFISPYDDKFKLVCWRTGMPVTYPLKIMKEMVGLPLGPSTGRVPKPDLVSAVSIAYGKNEFSGGFEQECSVGPDYSVAGYEFFNLRDEYLTIVAGVNDKLNWRNHVGAITTETFAAGEYTVEGWLTELNAKMGDVGEAFVFAIGAHVAAGINDKARVVIGATTRNAVLTPGFMTMEDRAADLQTLINTPTDIGFRCSYSRTTKKFTFSQTGGLAFTVFSNPADDAQAVFGFDTGTISVTAGNSVSSDIEVYEGLPVIARGQLFSLLLASGANGSENAANSCADVLGWLDLVDDTGPTVAPFITTGNTTKGTREHAMKTAAQRYGSKRAVQIQGRCLYDTHAARLLRNRVADLLSVPRTPIEFPTVFMPDVEIGQVFETDAGLDNLAPFTGDRSDGSWAGKRFVVTEYVHHLGPTKLASDVVCMEV